MKLIKILICAMLVLPSCNNDNIKFYGKTTKAHCLNPVNVLEGSSLELEGEYTGHMSVYDGILMFISNKHPDGYVYLYDSETGKKINAICKKGDGPDEVVSVNFYRCFERDSSGVCMWVNDVSKSNVILVNMQGEFIKKINTSKFKSSNFYGLGRFFMLNDGLLIAYMQSEEIFEGKAFAPSYRIFNYTTGDIVQDYKFYSDYTVSENAGIMPDMYLLSFDGIKPDKSKLAMAMTYLKRINILDLKSGKIKAIEIEDAPNLSLVSSEEPAKEYYIGLCCDDRYIYAMEGNFEQFAGTISVFDWEGNFVHVLQVKENSATEFAFDVVRKILYTKNDEEKIATYDLNFLYQ